MVKWLHQVSISSFAVGFLRGSDLTKRAIDLDVCTYL